MTGKRITIVMFSGGVDSTYALTRLLRETDDFLVAHHIHLVNQEGRHLAEARACSRIVDYLKEKIRPFEYSESTLDRRGMPSFGFDGVVAGFEAGLVSNGCVFKHGKHADRWTMGLNREELDEMQSSDWLRDRLRYILNAAEASAYPAKPPEYFRPPVKPKRELLSYLGPVLSDMCWVCRTPVDGYEPCGKCKSCKRLPQVA